LPRRGRLTRPGTVVVTRSLVRVPIPPRPLHARDLDPDPFVQFGRWFDDAEAHGQLQPDAMVVATSTADGRPSARMVLLRGVDERGFCFYTNFDSRKGEELAANPHAAIALHWPEVLRQVRAVGRVERVADDETDAYWQARPRPSRVSAWASAQSRPVASREELESRVAELEARFAGGDVPRPEGWGGFRVVPHEIEFWQHRDDRLHDRFVYTRAGSDDDWQVTRLQP
jgi:pyridoxamine 5'-phosphate oxidase